MSRRAACLALLATLGLGCATGRRSASGTLRIECNVPQATLRIDDVLLGRASDWSTPRPLGAGFHRVEIGEASHFTFYAEITLREGEASVVRAELRPLLE